MAEQLEILAAVELPLDLFTWFEPDGGGQSQWYGDKSGTSFYITGSEPAGYAIDNLTFGSANVVTGVPDAGSSLLLLGTGLALFGGVKRRLGK